MRLGCLNVLDPVGPDFRLQAPSDQLSSSSRKAPKILNSPIGNLGDFRPPKGTRSSKRRAKVRLGICVGTFGA
jgi:hypothetical protein